MTLPSGLMPTLIFLIPFVNCSEIILDPIKPPLEIIGDQPPPSNR
jgi:hypothetical protein